MATTETAPATRPATDGDAVPADMFELIARALNVAYWEWLPATNEIHFSAALYALFGYDPGTWTWQRHLELMHPDDRAGYRAMMTAYFKSGADRAQNSFRFKVPSGRYVWVHNHHLVQRDATGRVTRLVGTVTDITEAKEREAENRALIARQAASIEVLKTISASPDDPQPVFEMIARRARELCGAVAVTVCEYDGTLLHLRVMEGYDPAAMARAAKQFPMPAGRDTTNGRAALTGTIIRVQDVTADDEIGQVSRDLGYKSGIAAPLLRDGQVIGTFGLARFEVGGFDDAEIALVQSFAEQAVIAIASATTLRELRARTAELAARNTAFSEQIEHQSATIDVLKTMSASPGDAQPVFDLITRRAQEICNGEAVALFQYDGALIHLRSIAGFGDLDRAKLEELKNACPMPPSRSTTSGRVILDRQLLHLTDMQAESGIMPALLALGIRSQLALPLLRDGEPIGAIMLNSRSPGGFSDTQIELLKTFAEQAVIAIRSAETFRELEARTAELDARNRAFAVQVDHQAATIDVLKVMSSATNDTKPVFDAILGRALEFCNASMGALFERVDDMIQVRSVLGVDQPKVDDYFRIYPRAISREWIVDRAILDGESSYVADMAATLRGKPAALRALELRSQATVPLMREGVAIGCIALVSQQLDAFNEAHLDLLRTFAEQAVIATGSVATFRALQDRTAELTRSVAELQALEEVLRAVNSSLDLETVLATVISRAVQLSQADEGMIYEFDTAEQVFVPKATFGMTEERIARLRERRIRIGETYLGRSAVQRAPVHVDNVQRDTSTPEARELLQGIHAVLAVPLLREEAVIGGLVIRRRSEGAFAPTTVTLMQTFAGQCVLAIENARLFQEAARARAAAEAALVDLRRAQDRLVQTEKMASLGQLTAGIAHEIKNPLNFVNNFADLSRDLLDELLAALAPDALAVAADLRAEIDDLTATLKSNLRKITEHGRRADGIVKNMLLHSRESGGERRTVNLNAVAEEALNLAYHGARAEKPGFNVTLHRQLDPAVGALEIYPQEFTRVLLNLISNGFYAAARKKAGSADPDFQPTLTMTTELRPDHIAIRIRDNGIGIPDSVRGKMFEPFFTTKPAGEGTGLGLSLSHDIVVKQHGGAITVESCVGEFTEFTVTLPRAAAGGLP